MPTKEIDLPEILTDYDWIEVFGEGTGGNTDKKTDPCPPGAEINLTAPLLADISEVIAAVNGENDGAEWVGVVRLQDGRFCVAEGSCDYTGWDCRAGNHLQVAATLDDAIRFGLSDEQRTRLGVELN